jgi:RNA 2',3'-cyclic 3'-phosphodiesterase
MRLFAAVELDSDVRDVARDVASSLQRALGRTALDARWVAVENMHLTVRFVGHVADERAGALIAAISAPLAVAPFTIALDRCGVFPPSGPPRVIWIGLREGLESLRTIAAEMDRRVEPFGYEPERRPFSAHLTLARIKDVPRHAARDVKQIVLAHPVPNTSCRVIHATLFQSHLSPKGPRYEVVAEIPFNGSSG